MASRSSDSKLQELLSQLKTDGVQALDQLMDAYEERRAQRAAQLRATLRYVTPPTEEQLAQIRDFLRKKYQSEDRWTWWKTRACWAASVLRSAARNMTGA